MANQEASGADIAVTMHTAWIAAERSIQEAGDRFNVPDLPDDAEAQITQCRTLAYAILTAPPASLDGMLAVIDTAFNWISAAEEYDVVDPPHVLLMLAQALRRLGANVPTPTIDWYVNERKARHAH